MGTIAEKLNYLNDTRLKIKDGLNKFGADLTENDTFRSYSNVLNDIYDKLPKVSGNGSNFTLESVQKGKLDLFEMEGNTHQDSYTGKNLNIYPYATQGRDNGITFTINEDGTVILNGQNNNNGNSSKQFYYNLSNPRILEAGTYYIIPPSNNAISYVMYDGTNYYDFNANNNYSRTFNVQKEIQQFYVQVSKGNTTTLTNEKIYPMLSITPVTIDDYEPFVGGIPSPNPDYPQPIEVVTGDNTINVHGKNLLQITTFDDNTKTKTINGVTATINDDGSISASGTATANAVFALKKNTLNISGAFYYLCNSPSANARVELDCVVDGTRKYLNDYGNGNKQTANSSFVFNNLYVLITNGTSVDTTFKPMVALGTNVTEYQPYQSKDYEISLEDIELCKIGNYQDYLYKDGNDWYKHKEIGKAVLDGTQSISLTNWRASETSVGWVYKYNVFKAKTNAPSVVGAVMSNKLIAQKFDDLFNKNVDNGIATYSNTDYGFTIRTNDTTLTTTTAINNYLSSNPITTYYALETPTDELITNETLINQLETIETHTGTNIFEVSSDNAVLPSLNVKRLKELEKLS